MGMGVGDLYSQIGKTKSFWINDLVSDGDCTPMSSPPSESSAGRKTGPRMPAEGGRAHVCRRICLGAGIRLEPSQVGPLDVRNIQSFSPSY